MTDDNNGIRHHLREIERQLDKIVQSVESTARVVVNSLDEIHSIRDNVDALNARVDDLETKLDRIIDLIDQDVGASDAVMTFSVIPPRNSTTEEDMARPANWAIGEGYMAAVALTKEDGSPGTIQSGSGKFASADPAAVIEQIDDTHAKIKATANAAATVTWDGDGDLGSGVAPIHLEGVAVFSDVDIEATGGTLDFGEPVAV